MTDSGPTGEGDRSSLASQTCDPFAVRNFQSYLERSAGPDVRCRPQVSAASLTTFGVGAPVPLVVEPRTLRGLVNVLRGARESEICLRVLGAGSNVVLPDASLPAPILKLGKELGGIVPSVRLDRRARLSAEAVDVVARGATFELSLTEAEQGEGTSIFAFAATPLMRLSREVSQLGLSGLEFAAGIPASVGGAVRMNAGAHGHSMEEVVRAVLVTTPGEADHDQPFVWLGVEELSYRYRESTLPEGAVVVGAELLLRPGDPAAIAEKRVSCLEYRRATQPLHLPSAGSVFRNPSRESLTPDIISAGGGAAGWLLERAGLKGERKGGVEFSTLHANWLVRVDDSGRADDVATLQREGQSRVQDLFGISLHSEIILW